MNFDELKEHIERCSFVAAESKSIAKVIYAGAAFIIAREAFEAGYRAGKTEATLEKKENYVSTKL